MLIMLETLGESGAVNLNRQWFTTLRRPAAAEDKINFRVVDSIPSLKNLSILSNDSPTVYEGHTRLYHDSLIEVV